VWDARRRRRALLTIRREFAECGYPLDGVADDEIEAALPTGAVDDPSSHLGAKTINWAIRRLPRLARIESRRAARGFPHSHATKIETT
jgi:hypothetical protein